MTTVLIVVHLMVVLAMIGLVLLQRSEGGALGIGGGSGGFMTGRSAANVLTRATGLLAIAFFATSLGLAMLARLASAPSDILEIPGAPGQVDTGIPAPPLPAGGPQSAEDLLESLGGAGGIEDAPAAPAESSAATPPAANGAATPAPTAPAPPAQLAPSPSPAPAPQPTP